MGDAALCVALILMLGPLPVQAASPSSLPPYVHDELSVKFFSPPTETELEIFEVKYRLTHVRELLAPRWHLFHIEDGADAAMKAEWVLEDPSVCAVQLSFLGEWAATTRELKETECQKPEPASASETPAADTNRTTTRSPDQASNPQTGSSDGASGRPGFSTGWAIVALAISLAAAAGLMLLLRLGLRRA